jgi:hypothetical protein
MNEPAKLKWGEWKRDAYGRSTGAASNAMYYNIFVDGGDFRLTWSTNLNSGAGAQLGTFETEIEAKVAAEKHHADLRKKESGELPSLTNISTADIQNELLERGLVAIPLDWMTDAQRGRLVEESRRDAGRDFRQAEALEKHLAGKKKS